MKRKNETIMATKKNVTTKKTAKATGKAAAANDATVAQTVPRATKTPKKAAEKKPASTALEIHINKTGRVCFGKNAAARIGDLGHMLMTGEGKQVRMVAKKEAAENTVEIRRANGRPYVSATKFLKLLGFDGSKPFDIEAAAYNTHGFEFKVA
jgi:hypothetical protein